MDLFEVDRLQSFAVNAEPTKSYAVGNPVECLGYTINLELNPLYAAGIAKMIKIPKKIFHFEPDNTLTSVASGIVFLSGYLHTGYRGHKAVPYSGNGSLARGLEGLGHRS